ncbi:hypothetical protein M3P05_11215, partial [Sansalvadorimonas sp. 2012CJ34-2]
LHRISRRGLLKPFPVDCEAVVSARPPFYRGTDTCQPADFPEADLNLLPVSFESLSCFAAGQRGAHSTNLRFNVNQLRTEIINNVNLISSKP